MTPHPHPVSLIPVILALVDLEKNIREVGFSSLIEVFFFFFSIESFESDFNEKS